MTDGVEQYAFHPGDVVQLKKVSGPWMTVEQLRPLNDGKLLVNCVWFDKRRRVQRDSFDDFALEVVKERQPVEVIEKGRLRC